jgi:hypothetical protein
MELTMLAGPPVRQEQQVDGLQAVAETGASGRGEMAGRVCAGVGLGGGLVGSRD